MLFRKNREATSPHVPHGTVGSYLVDLPPPGAFNTWLPSLYRLRDEHGLDAVEIKFTSLNGSVSSYGTTPVSEQKKYDEERARAEVLAVS